MAFAPRGPMNQPTIVPPSNQAAVVNALEPGMIMHGNQPGVARANPAAGSMQVTTDTSKLGPERFTTTTGPVPSPDGGAGVQGQRLGAEIPGASGGKGWGTSPIEGFDGGKIARGHSSPKYQIGQVASRYDPKMGITPEMLAELNALGLGTFTGSRDKLYVSGNVDPRFEGYTTIDMVRGFNGPGGGQAWQYGAENPNAPAQQAAAPQAAGGGMGGGFASASGGVNGLLGGNPYQGITDALGKLTQGGQVNIEALIRQLQGV